MQNSSQKRSKRVSLGLLVGLVLSIGTGCQNLFITRPDNFTPTVPQTAPNHAPGDLVEFGTPLSPGQRKEVGLWTTQEQTTQARVWGVKSDQPMTKFGIIFVSGVNGGYEEPCDLIYDRFAAELALTGVTPIFVKYRNPGVLSDSIEDVQAAAGYLRNRGVSQIALAGWSFGGAVVIQSAVQIPEVKTVTTFAGQSLDTEAVSKFTHQSLLIFHSRMDENVPFYAAQQIYEQAPATIRKDLIWLDMANHLLDGASAQIDPVFRNWLRTELLKLPATGNPSTTRSPA